MDHALKCLARGARLNVVESDGRTPLEYAAIGGNRDLVRYIFVRTYVRRAVKVRGRERKGGGEGGRGGGREGRKEGGPRKHQHGMQTPSVWTCMWKVFSDTQARRVICVCFVPALCVVTGVSQGAALTHANGGQEGVQGADTAIHLDHTCIYIDIERE